MSAISPSYVTVQARVYLPEEPFPHAALVRAGRLKHARALHDDAFSADFRQVSHVPPALTARLLASPM